MMLLHIARRAPRFLIEWGWVMLITSSAVLTGAYWACRLVQWVSWLYYMVTEGRQ